jgi:uncharacterized protein YdeI (YjbR/CyaY-like superfamily)
VTLSATRIEVTIGDVLGDAGCSGRGRALSKQRPLLQAFEVETMSPSQDQPTLFFPDAAAFDAWLDEHHATSPGIWLKLAKKGADVESVSYSEAVEVALCHGWIDGQKGALDERFWRQRFTPRRSASLWSKANREKADTLIDVGRMRPAGLAAITAARRDGRWEQAYEGQGRIAVPDDLQQALQANPEAAAFFATLTGANRYAVLHRIATARTPETRARRVARFIEMLNRRETVY